MKVLILHQHFKLPQHGGAIRSYYLAKALVEKGVEIVIVTAHNEKTYLKTELEGIEIHYLPVSYDNSFGFGQRSFSFLKFIWGVLNKSYLFNNVDFCYAISTPLTVGIAALWIKRVKKVPFIFEVGDLWPEAPIQMGFVKNPFFKWILYKLEQTIYNGARAIVALSPSIQKTIQNKNTRKQVLLIPNMADISFYAPEEKQINLERKFQVEGKFVVSYIGALGFANGLDYFLDCARASQKANLPIHFLLCGSGAMQRGLKESAKRLQLQNLSFIPFQNREGVRDLMNVTDASFICYKSVPVLETGSPNKYFDGLAAGKLIIVNFGGWIKEEIEQHGCGIHIDPFHPTDFVKRISGFIEDKNVLRQFQSRSRELATKKYSRNILGERFAEIFMGL